MNKLKCLIVDDEPPALNLLEGYISRTPFLELKGKCSDAFKALEYIGLSEIDLVFLDIQMPEFSGIELSRTLNSDIMVIFTSAFQEYAVEGYRVDAVDYLLKPFSYEEFLKAASKACGRIPPKAKPLCIEQSASILFVKSGNKLLRVELAKVIFIEGFKDYVKIHLTDAATPVVTLMSMKTLEEKLPPQLFMRIHRSFIINLSHIKALERSQVLIGNQRITIREPYVDKLDPYISSRCIRV